MEPLPGEVRPCLAWDRGLNNIIALAIPLFAFIVIGFLAGIVGGRHASIERRDLVWLNVFVVYIAIPALIFRLIARSPVDQLANWGFIIATTLGTYLVFMLMFVVASIVGRERTGTAAMQSAAASYGNVGYMGVPLAVAVFGEAGVVPATLIFCFDSALLFIMVPLLISVSRTEEGAAAALLQALRNIALNPLIIALLLGVIAAIVGIDLTGPAGKVVDSTLAMLGGAAAPAALFGIGITIARQYSLRSPVQHEVLVIATLKLLVHPFLVMLLMTMLGGFDPVWVSVAILLAALPMAANVYAMASQFDIYAEGASAALLVTTTLSLFTLPLMMILMAEGVVPFDPFPG